MRAPTIIALAVVLGGTAYGIAQVDHSTMDHDGHVPGVTHGSVERTRRAGVHEHAFP